MADNFNPDQMVVDLTPLEKFTPVQGIGTSDLLSQDGIFKLNLEVAKPKQSEKGDVMLLCAFAIDPAEGGADAGKRLVRNVMAGGVDKNKEPMVRQLGELLMSAGRTTDQVRTEIAGFKTSTLSKVCGFVEAEVKVAYGRCRAKPYEGQLVTEIEGFVSAEEYEAAKKNGSYRKAHRPTAGGAGAAQAAMGGAQLGAAPAPQAAPAGGAAAAQPNGVAGGKASRVSL